MNMIFCVGMPRTGTTTFHHMMKSLGFNSISNVHGITTPDEAINYAKNGEFNAFSDNPWHTYWRELAETFTEAKFINLVRDAEQWRFSFLKMTSHTHKSPEDVKKKSPWRIGAVKEFINDPKGELFTQRNKDVSSYFGDSQNFIELDWSKHGYLELTNFLGLKPVEKKAINVSMFKDININGLKAIAENLTKGEQERLWQLLKEMK